MSPPSLTFTREFRTSLDVVIRFTPRATGVEVIHQQGHIFLLSDLFLVCERMLPEDRDKWGSGGADMWLCYPPLAGKVLRVSEVTGQSMKQLIVECLLANDIFFCRQCSPGCDYEKRTSYSRNRLFGK